MCQNIPCLDKRAEVSKCKAYLSYKLQQLILVGESIQLLWFQLTGV